MLHRPSVLVERILGCAIEVHRSLGPGLLESAYTRCLTFEMQSVGLAFRPEVPVPVVYKGTHLDCAYRADFVIDEVILVEIKSIDHLLPIHTAQVLTYLKLLKLRQGILINFNVRRLVDGVKNVLN